MNWVVGLDGHAQQLLALRPPVGDVVDRSSRSPCCWLQSYAFLEKAQMVIVARALGLHLRGRRRRPTRLDRRPLWHGHARPFPTTTLGCSKNDPSIATRPPWVEVITCVGAVGGGTYDYVGYVGCCARKAGAPSACATARTKSLRTSPRCQSQSTRATTTFIARASLAPAGASRHLRFASSACSCSACAS